MDDLMVVCPGRALDPGNADTLDRYPPPQRANASVSLIGEEDTNTGQHLAGQGGALVAWWKKRSKPTKILLASTVGYVAVSFGSMMLKVISGKQSAKTAAKEFLSDLLATMQAVVKKLGGYVGKHTEGDGAGKGVSASGA